MKRSCDEEEENNAVDRLKKPFLPFEKSADGIASLKRASVLGKICGVSNNNIKIFVDIAYENVDGI